LGSWRGAISRDATIPRRRRRDRERLLARRFWGSPANAIGKRLRFPETGIGGRLSVSRKDVKNARLNKEPRPRVFAVPAVLQPNMTLQVPPRRRR
jgi:hypothetical protein